MPDWHPRPTLQCFIGFGVCKGTHDYLEGRSAMAADEAWMLSTQAPPPSPPPHKQRPAGPADVRRRTQSGKVYCNGGEDTQVLPGVGTPPFFPHDKEKMATSVRPREGDRVGVLVDRSGPPAPEPARARARGAERGAARQAATGASPST
jgi:hypothetical protein